MPCSDVTEALRLVLDPDDRLVSYQLIKNTCGRAVGEQDLLQGEFGGANAQTILDLGVDEFAEAHPLEDEAELFLHLKHFFALQSGLKALLGMAPGGPKDAVRVARVVMEEENVVLEAEILVDIITEQIASCGKCSGCGTIAAKISRAVT